MPEADFVLLEGGEVYAPEPRGRVSVLLDRQRISTVGAVDLRASAGQSAHVETLDASGCLVTPALIDVHEHLIGGSGESGGFSTQTPEIFLHELLTAGIGTVVGCLGTDAVTKTMPSLLAKVKALREQGVSAFLYTGGYPVPPATLTGSVRNDILFVEEVIGAGEVAIADYRSSAPSLAELARLAREASVAGMLSGKAGVTHFHVGDGRERLQVLRDLLADFELEPSSLYPTHVERSEELFDEAIDLTREGVTVDVDVVEEDLLKWMRRYRENGGDPERLTASSDAAINSPSTLLAQVVDCIRGGVPIDCVLMLVTQNPARVLKLARKGRLTPGNDADVAAIDRASGTLRHLVANGRIMVRDGRPIATERFLTKSNRRIELHGQKN